jgi:IclR family transcriptional regulator, KDG regulon repressor
MLNQYNIKVLEKMVKILGLYNYKDDAFTLSGIIKRTGLPKTTVFKIIKTLESAGFFKYDPAQEKYSLGLRFLELGGIVYSSISVRKAAAPYMDSLSNTLKATILLGVIKDDKLLYIDKREKGSIIRVLSRIGFKRPPYRGMLGMILLAYMDNKEKRRFLMLYPPTKNTDETDTNIHSIMKKLDEAKKKGYYMEKDEVTEGLIGIGVPIMDFSGKVVAALGAAQPVFQLKEDTVENTIQQLLKASQSISRELGYRCLSK